MSVATTSCESPAPVSNVRVDLSVNASFLEIMEQEGLLLHDLEGTIDFIDDLDEAENEWSDFEPSDEMLKELEAGVRFENNPEADRRIRGKIAELGLIVERMRSAKTATQVQVLQDLFLAEQHAFIHEHASSLNDEELRAYLYLVEELSTVADMVMAQE